MIIREEKPRPLHWLQRFLRPWGNPPLPPLHPRLLSDSAFDLAVTKEISRCDRNSGSREFCLLILRPEEQQERRASQLIQLLAERLRITDELGFWRGELSALLPETNRAGGSELAGQIRQLAEQIPLQIETEVQVYPWDDRIASRSEELAEPACLIEGSRQLKMDRIEPGLRVVEESDMARRAFFSGGASLRPTSPTPLWKRSFDLLASSLGLIILSPVLCSAALAIRLNSPGPVFFTQLREGKDGKVFRIVKFRTMRPGAEQLRDLLAEFNEQDGPAFKIQADPRVTPVGRYLRRTCIDELPQLFNVLRGDMSIVGPRPLPVGESYASRTWHRHRLTALPGLTCIWQVAGARKVSFDQWMRMDLEYLRRRSLWFDLNLIARTAWVVLSHRGSV